MPQLVLGVVDVPYASEEGKTTGDIAEILEAKYHIMEHFFQMHDADIAKCLEDALAGSIENMLLGAPAPADPYAAGTEKINDMFRRFLAERELDQLGYPGIPTAAALAGVSNRFKDKGRSRRAKAEAAGEDPSRPSFIDTGLYQSAFKSWWEA